MLTNPVPVGGFGDQRLGATSSPLPNPIIAYEGGGSGSARARSRL